jgi:hypothetical protein
MVDAPWLSPRKYSGAFFIFGHWALVIILSSPSSPHPLISPFPLGVGTTSGKGRLSK